MRLVSCNTVGIASAASTVRSALNNIEVLFVCFNMRKLPEKPAKSS